MDFITQFGIRTEHKEDAARLYAIAFQTKFLKILGSPEEVRQLLKDGINIQRGISAISADNELLGISGFQLDNTSLTDIKFRTCVSKYGIIKGTLKYVVLAAIFYRKPDKKSQLLMDGIAVKEGNRGRGIGKQLFIELEKFSIQSKMTSIKLDVIDENPKAKKLYESIGFVPTKYNKTPNFIYKLIGVRGVTTMVKEL
jgi:ribosomal protein S18 acetylase RimI-like enzyme